ncbi:HK97 gp10 family phage protein [Streptomyces sp. NPDC037389]|uniref:HK97 gp10 family phage protein n=1 Tax=Streptomyces sp. NPDC037389 TaxID=3155369 RepID=UPI0033F3D550
MGDGVKVRVYRKGIRAMLNTAMVATAMVHAGEVIAARARASAPVETGVYRDSFEVWGQRRMGAKRDRAGAVVINTARHAMAVEYGTAGTPAHHTLWRAAARRQQ